MKFIELNKKRHATKHFNNKKVDLKDIRTAIEIATLAPTAHNLQPWKFVIVDQKKEALANIMYGKNGEQVAESQYAIVIFTDTNLEESARDLARLGVHDLPERLLEFYSQIVPAQFEHYTDKQRGEYLALNAGIGMMNLWLSLTDQGLSSNAMLGVDKSKANEVLEIDKRFRPEIVLTVGYTDDVIEPSFRKSVDDIIEIR